MVFTVAFVNEPTKSVFMKKFLLLFLFAFIIIGAANAQSIPTSVQKNTVFLELGGNGVYYSLNYDRILLAKTNWKLVGRVGAMYHTHFAQRAAIPLELSYLRGRKNHHLEFGLGVTPLYEFFQRVERDQNQALLINTALLYSSRIGYRYQKKGWRPVLEGRFYTCFRI